MKTFVNAHGAGEVVIGANTSQLLENLAYCYSQLLGPDDEVQIVAGPPSILMLMP